MKIKNVILALAACAGLFSACSNEIDEVTSGNEQETQKNAYASFTFAMPAGTGTKAEAPTEEGSSEENQITDVQIFLFNNTTSTLAQTISLDRAAFTPTNLGSTTFYTTKEPQKVAANAYTVYIVVNPANLGTIAANTTLADFQAMVENVPVKSGDYCTNNNFMMTNAETVANAIVTVTENNKKNNPASLTVKVERTAAKIVFTGTTDNTYSIKDNKGNANFGTIAFDAYKVINTRNSAYNYKRVGMSLTDNVIGASEDPVKYVVENIFDKKSSTFDAATFDANYSRRYDSYVAFRNLNKGTATQSLAYCLENTMLQDAQLKGYTTGVVFRAKIALASGNVVGELTADGSLYRYADVYYASLLDLVKKLNPNWASGDESLAGITVDVLDMKKHVKQGGMTIMDYFKSINNITSLHNLGVDFFVNGYCYYTYWLRHANNNDDTKGIMEFAIVRNNVYKISINSVKAIGEISSGTKGPKDPTKPGEGQADVEDNKTNPEIPGTVVNTDQEPEIPVVPIDPGNPDEDTDTYLNVSISVLPWTVRYNPIDF